MNEVEQKKRLDSRGCTDCVMYSLFLLVVQRRGDVNRKVRRTKLERLAVENLPCMPRLGQLSIDIGAFKDDCGFCALH